MGGAGAFRDHCSESDEDGHLTGWVNPSSVGEQCPEKDRAQY